MTYQLLNETSGVLRLSDGAVVPDDPANLDWCVYQSWLQNGNTPAPATASKGAANASLASLALDASDRTLLRCMEADINLPPAWTAYRRTLRRIITGDDTDLPVRPPYPPGT